MMVTATSPEGLHYYRKEYRNTKKLRRLGGVHEALRRRCAQVIQRTDDHKEQVSVADAHNALAPSLTKLNADELQALGTILKSMQVLTR